MLRVCNIKMCLISHREQIIYVKIKVQHCIRGGCQVEGDQKIIHTDLLAYGFVVEYEGKIFIGTNKDMIPEDIKVKEAI
jgi:hypothetical protein